MVPMYMGYMVESYMAVYIVFCAPPARFCLWARIRSM